MPTNNESEVDFSAYDHMLPEGAVPLSGWRLVYFMDEAGDERMRWWVDGDPLVTTSIAMAEMLKFDLLHNACSLGHGDDD